MLFYLSLESLRANIMGFSEESDLAMSDILPMEIFAEFC
jgi:hypothetical protein